MRHPMDRSPRVVKVHLWELEGKRHHRCSVCWLVVPQEEIGRKSLPLCRPDGGNDGHCINAPLQALRPLREQNHSDSWYDHTGDCSYCGAPTELPRPGFTLPESNCRHEDIGVRMNVAVCSFCGKTMVGW